MLKSKYIIKILFNFNMQNFIYFADYFEQHFNKEILFQAVEFNFRSF